MREIPAQQQPHRTVVRYGLKGLAALRRTTGYFKSTALPKTCFGGIGAQYGGDECFSRSTVFTRSGQPCVDYPQVRTSTRDLPVSSHTYGALVAKDVEGAGAGKCCHATRECKHK